MIYYLKHFFRKFSASTKFLIKNDKSSKVKLHASLIEYANNKKFLIIFFLKITVFNDIN